MIKVIYRAVVIQMLIVNAVFGMVRVNVDLQGELYYAACRGDIDDCDEIPRILRRGALVNEEFAGKTALYAAAEYGKVGAVNVLLAADADIRKGCEDETPLHIAAANGHNDVVLVLLQKANEIGDLKYVNGSEDCLDTPLIVAARYNHLDVVDTLIQGGADIDCADGNESLRENALYAAAKRDHRKIVERLLLADADVCLPSRERDQTPLFVTAKKGHFEVAKLLLKRSGLSPHMLCDYVNQPAGDSCTPLFIAAENGWYRIVSLLLKQRAEVEKSCVFLEQRKDPYRESDDKTIDTPLSIATCNNHIRVVERLLSAHANINTINRSEFTMRTVGEQVQEITENSPLAFALASGSEEMVELLLSSGLRPLGGCVKETIVTDLTDEVISSRKIIRKPLMFIAAERGDVKSVELLIEVGVNPDEPCTKKIVTGDDREINKETKPVYIAMRKGHIAVVEALLNVKVDTRIPHKGKRWKSLFFIAIKKGHVEGVKLLLADSSERLKINKKDRDGNTLLFTALRFPRREMITLLLENGADPELECNGERAIDIARSEIENARTAGDVANESLFGSIIETLMNRKYRNVANEVPEDKGSLLAACKFVEMDRVPRRNRASRVSAAVPDGSSSMPSDLRENRLAAEPIVADVVRGQSTVRRRRVPVGRAGAHIPETHSSKSHDARETVLAAEPADVARGPFVVRHRRAPVDGVGADIPDTHPSKSHDAQVEKMLELRGALERLDMADSEVRSAFWHDLSAYCFHDKNAILLKGIFYEKFKKMIKAFELDFSTFADEEKLRAFYYEHLAEFGDDAEMDQKFEDLATERTRLQDARSRRLDQEDQDVAAIENEDR